MSTSDDLAETARLVKEAGSEMVAVESDVRDQEQVDAAFRAGPQSFGRVDIVLGNAGILHDFKRTWLLEEDEFRKRSRREHPGVRHTVNAAVSTMIEQGDGGAIVPAGSAASVTGINDLAGYAASKHAVLCIARTLAKELGRYQIRVNAVLPGNCNTRCSTTRTSASSTCRALPSRRTRSSTTAPPR